MAKINKIKLSGTTYDVEDLNATKTVELTQAQYDALVSGGTVDPNTYYIITDASGADLSQYWTSAQTQSAITQSTSGLAESSAVTEEISAATSGKVDTSAITSSVTSASTDSEIPTAKAVYDAVESGGGASYSAGTNISIANDTISCTLPISAGTGTKSIVLGDVTPPYASAPFTIAGGYNSGRGYHYTYAKKGGSIAFGAGAVTEGFYSQAFGEETQTKNISEFASGIFNTSSSGSSTFGDSGNTLFSVGNGTADNARHNAFEIRQNGDIYCNNGTSDVKLQDYLQIKVVQITQAAYDALVSGGTVDASTLYIIVN